MKISKQAKRDAKQLFRSCVQNGLLDENRVRQAVSGVIAKKPRGYVGILSQLERLVKLDIFRRTARVESPAALSPEQQNSLSANLGAKYGPGLELLIVPSEPGPARRGLCRIQVGSDVYDGSVRARLENLRESF